MAKPTFLRFRILIFMEFLLESEILKMTMIDFASEHLGIFKTSFIQSCKHSQPLFHLWCHIHKNEVFIYLIINKSRYQRLNFIN